MLSAKKTDELPVLLERLWAALRRGHGAEEPSHSEGPPLEKADADALLMYVTVYLEGHEGRLATSAPLRGVRTEAARVEQGAEAADIWLADQVMQADASSREKEDGRAGGRSAHGTGVDFDTSAGGGAVPGES